MFFDEMEKAFIMSLPPLTVAYSESHKSFYHLMEIEEPPGRYWLSYPGEERTALPVDAIWWETLCGNP